MGIKSFQGRRTTTTVKPSEPILVSDYMTKNLITFKEDQPIEDVIPLQLTKDGELITGYDMDDVADLMVKFDILGLKTLTIAQKTCEKINIDFNNSTFWK